METLHSEIKKDYQIKKFCAYGFLKNLKFFEPYLLIYFIGLGLNLFQIGILYSIREFITYIFEVPSGVFADTYGKKKELMICFTFYMISFVIFFFAANFLVLSLAMVLFGLGEAFRSGTHKAMIYTYLEQKKWFNEKTFVYGRTRSFSLIGSAISSFVSIIFVLNLPSVKWIFLICIIPYVLDFILIWSYPDSLDEKHYAKFNFMHFLSESFRQVKEIFQSRDLKKILMSSSLFDSIFKSIKDYIQPILKLTIIASAGVAAFNVTPEDKVTIVLGITYGVFYIFSSIASRNVHKLSKIGSSKSLSNKMFDVMAICLIMLSIGVKNNITTIIIVMKDARRPLIVDVLGDYMHKSQRATVLSVDSQLRALFTIILAPLFGFIASYFSIEVLFIVIGVLIIIGNRTIGRYK